MVKDYERLTTLYRDLVAKRKIIILAHLRSTGAEGPLPNLAPRSAAEPSSIQRTLDSAAGAVKQDWLGSGVEVTLNNKISTSGDRMLPWPAGHLQGEGREGAPL